FPPLLVPRVPVFAGPPPHVPRPCARLPRVPTIPRVLARSYASLAPPRFFAPPRVPGLLAVSYPGVRTSLCPRFRVARPRVAACGPGRQACEDRRPSCDQCHG